MNYQLLPQFTRSTGPFDFGLFDFFTLPIAVFAIVIIFCEIYKSINHENLPTRHNDLFN